MGEAVQESGRLWDRIHRLRFALRKLERECAGEYGGKGDTLEGIETDDYLELEVGDMTERAQPRLEEA